jgi:hypothetical protein
MSLGPNQPVTELSTRNLPEGKGRPAVYECIVEMDSGVTI